MRGRFEIDDMPSGFCDECGEEATGVPVDFGIGPYEFWGSREVQEDWRIVSPCCEADVVEEKPVDGLGEEEGQ